MRGIGEMNHRVVLQGRDVDESDGSMLDTWHNLFPYSMDAPDGSCWAARQDMNNKQFHQASAAQTELTVIFTVRTPANVKLDSGLRILEDGEEYYAIGRPIINKPRRGFTEIRAAQRGMEGYGSV